MSDSGVFVRKGGLDVCPRQDLGLIKQSRETRDRWGMSEYEHRDRELLTSVVLILPWPTSLEFTLIFSDWSDWIKLATLPSAVPTTIAGCPSLPRYEQQL